MPRAKVLTAAAVVLVLAAVGIWVRSGREPGRAEPRPAVSTEPPPSVFLAPDGSDGPCTAQQPCSTFERAYQTAKPGEVVEIAAGRYPAQLLRDEAPSGDRAPVVFRPAAGAAVTVASLSLEGPSDVTFRGFRVAKDVRVLNSDPSIPGSHGVTFQDLRAQTVKIIGRVSHIAVLGGTYGDTLDWQPQIIKYNPGDPDSSRPADVLIDGVTFRNFRRSGPDVHTECLQVLSVDGLVVRNSRFDDCDGTGDIGITNGPSTDLTFENNFLGKAGDAFYSMQITRNVRNLVLRYNSAAKAAVFSDTETGGPYTVTGNYMRFSDGLCVPGGTYSHNVFAGGICGPTDLSVPAMRFADESRFNLHLAPGSEAIDHGDPGSYPRTDIDGQRRPLGSAPDAGADEAR